MRDSAVVWMCIDLFFYKDKITLHDDFFSWNTISVDFPDEKYRWFYIIILLSFNAGSINVITVFYNAQ